MKRDDGSILKRICRAIGVEIEMLAEFSMKKVIQISSSRKTINSFFPFPDRNLLFRANDSVSGEYKNRNSRASTSAIILLTQSFRPICENSFLSPLLIIKLVF